MSREPVVIVQAITAAIVAGLAAFVNSGGASMSADTQAQLTALIVSVGWLVGTFVSRSLVTPSADPRNAQGKSLT